MTGKQKDRLVNTALGIVTGCAVILFGLFWETKKDKEAASKTDLNSKLDVTEYYQDQQQRWDNHNAIELEKAKRDEDMYEMVKYLYKNQGGQIRN